MEVWLMASGFAEEEEEGTIRGMDGEKVLARKDAGAEKGS